VLLDYPEKARELKVLLNRWMDEDPKSMRSAVALPVAAGPAVDPEAPVPLSAVAGKAS
jgi:hypothetical protein